MTLLRDTSVAQSSNGLLVHVDQDGIVLSVDAEAAVTGLSKQQMQHLAAEARLRKANEEAKARREQERREAMERARQAAGNAREHIEMLWIPARLLYVRDDPETRFQRPLDEKRVDEMARDWDWRECEALSVGPEEADGHHEILEGQHRWWAAQLCFGTDEVELPCRVVDADDVAERAGLFVDMSRGRKSIRSDTAFAGMLLAQRPEAVAVARVVQSLGLELDLREAQHPTRNRIAATWTLLKLFQACGEAGLREVLRVIQDAWKGEPSGFMPDHLRGVAYFLALYYTDSKYHRKRLIEVMERAGPAGVQRNALNFMSALGNSRAASVAAALHGLYCGRQSYVHNLKPFPIQAGQRGALVRKQMAYFGSAAQAAAEKGSDK
jgi:hypothetical protein